MEDQDKIQKVHSKIWKNYRVQGVPHERKRIVYVSLQTSMIKLTVYYIMINIHTYVFKQLPNKLILMALFDLKLKFLN